MECLQLTGAEPDVVSCVVRQWFTFPQHATNAVRTSRLRDFRLLIETDSGHLMFIALKGKTSPDADMARRVAGLLVDTDPYLDRAGADSALHELGLHAKLLNSPIDSAKVWLPATVLAEALLDEMLKLQPGERMSDDGRSRLEESLRQQLRTGIQFFVRNLNKLVVEAARSAEAGLCRPSSYNYLRGSGAADCVLGRNRTQAVVIFPFLLPILPVDPWLAPVRKAIDEGKPPLIDVLASHFGVPKSAIRSLRNQPGASIGPQWALRPDILAMVIADIPPHLRPQTADGWRSFNASANLISEISGRPIQTTANRLWMRTAAMQGYRVSDAADAELDRAAHDIDELSNRLTDALNFHLRQATGLSHRAGVSAAVHAFVMAQNPIRLAKIALRWRNAYIREQANFSDERQLWIGVRWHAVLDHTYETATRSIVCLTTVAELVAEGKAMNNCAASYTGPCLQGTSQIWSIRDLAGERLSTLETTIKGPTKVRIVQIKGPGNISPTGDCISAADLLIKRLCRKKADIERYCQWWKDIANRPTDERTMIALTKPIIAALNAALPKQWSFDKLLSIARNTSGERPVLRSAGSIE